MSNFLLFGINEDTELFRDLQKVLARSKKARLIPLSRFARLEDALLGHQFKKSGKTQTLDFEEGIKLIEQIITTHGGKV